jgi:hypothetical protein
MNDGQTTEPKAGPYLCDESGQTNHWRADAYSPDDIHDEWDYLFESAEQLHEVWLRVRLSTPGELADEDWVYEQFGDVEINGADTAQVYDRVKASTPGAHLYWSTEP